MKYALKTLEKFFSNLFLFSNAFVLRKGAFPYIFCC